MNDEYFLKTERLALRAWKLDDAGALYAIASNPRVAKPAGIRPYGSLAHCRYAIFTSYIPENSFAITLRSTGEVIGDIGIMFNYFEQDDDLPLGEAAIGLFIGEPWWNKGYMTELMPCMIDFAFRDFGLKKLWASQAQYNKASRHVIEKCGFELQPETFTWSYGETDDVWLMTRDRWLALRADGKWRAGK